MGSHAEGLDNLAYGSYTHAEGKSTSAFGEYSHTAGQSVSSMAAYSFAWSGRGAQYKVPAERSGTFNIDPVNGLSGFYIGDSNLSLML